jgi:transcriptional regulator with XRE-family HTH domain
MNKKDFGRLTAALRQDLNLTQFALAEKADVTVAVVSQIERGVKQNLEADLVARLAGALDLNINERRQFFLAASGLDEYDFGGEAFRSQAARIKKSLEVFEKLLVLLGKLRAPAYILDVFGESVAANASALAFYQITPAMIEEAPGIPGGYNSLRLLFGSILSSVVTTEYNQYLLNSVRSVREISLRYRAHPYFRYLINEFRDPKKYPGFERYWRHSALLEDDKDIDIDLFEFVHAIHGEMKFLTHAIMPNTPHGELRLIYSIPLDGDTRNVFEQIVSKVGAQAYRFAPWPEKKMV